MINELAKAMLAKKQEAKDKEFWTDPTGLGPSFLLCFRAIPLVGKFVEQSFGACSVSFCWPMFMVVRLVGCVSCVNILVK